MRKRMSLYLLVLLFMASCAPKVVQLTKKKDNVYTTTELRDFLAKSKRPKVVLRLSKTLAQDEKNAYLFDAIEQQLLSSGFIIRDNKLFEQIIENQGNNTDYKKLSEQSDTDLIIELINIQPVLYRTNKYLNKNGKQKSEDDNVFWYFHGVKVNFKLSFNRKQ